MSVSYHGRRVSEEVLDLALVAVGRVLLAHGVLESQATRERLHRARGGVAVPESGPLKACGVESAPEAQEVEQLWRHVEDAQRSQRLGRVGRGGGRGRAAGACPAL